MQEHITNRITIHGRLVGPIKYSHEIYNDVFYTLSIKCKRMSGTYDIVPIIVTESILKQVNQSDKSYYIVKGQIRSYNKYVDNKNKLIVTVYAKSIQPAGIEREGLNSVYLHGYICKKPNYRKTPFLREICDVLLAVNRPHGKSDYIPIIVWGQTARSASSYLVGESVMLTGRFQSREYTKHQKDGTLSTMVAYEISAMKIGRADNKWYE